MGEGKSPVLRKRLLQRLAAYFLVVGAFCAFLTAGSLYGYYRSTIDRETREVSAHFERYQRDALHRVKTSAELFAAGQQTFCNDKKAVNWLRGEGMTILGGGTPDEIDKLAAPGATKEVWKGQPVVEQVWYKDGPPGILVALPLNIENGQVTNALVAVKRLDAQWLKGVADTVGAEFGIFDREGRTLAASIPLEMVGYTTALNGKIVEVDGVPYGFRIFPHGEEGLYGVFLPAGDLRSLAFILSGALAAGFCAALLILFLYYRSMIADAAGEIEALAVWADGYLSNPEKRKPPTLVYYELRLVGEAFDNLVSRLDMALGEIESHNQELAALVAQKTGELVERGQLLDTIVSEMPQSVFLLEKDGTVLYANVHALENFGILPGSGLPDGFSSVVSRMGGAPTDFAFEFDGKDFLIHSRLIESQARRLFLAMDVTERRVMEEQLYQTQKMESVSRLAGGVAHDFNNALAAILPSVDMLRIKVSDEKALSYVENIEKAALRGADVVRKLLAFSRAGTFNPKPLEVNEAIEGAIKLFKPSAKNAELVWLPGAGLPKVYGDEAQLQQLIFNLGINSLDATDGRVKITLKTWTDGTREKVFISIEDDGPGVSSEIAPHIFEPFYTTKKQSQQKTQGTGLGLAVAYGVVDRHGGRIRLLSGGQPGALFEIELPAWSEAVPAKSAERGGRSAGDIVIGAK